MFRLSLSLSLNDFCAQKLSGNYWNFWCRNLLFSHLPCVCLYQRSRRMSHVTLSGREPATLANANACASRSFYLREKNRNMIQISQCRPQNRLLQKNLDYNQIKSFQNGYQKSSLLHHLVPSPLVHRLASRRNLRWYLDYSSGRLTKRNDFLNIYANPKLILSLNSFNSLLKHALVSSRELPPSLKSSSLGHVMSVKLLPVEHKLSHLLSKGLNDTLVGSLCTALLIEKDAIIDILWMKEGGQDWREE